MNAAPTAPVVANPTLTSDGARYGVAVTQVEYPAGVGGVKLSLVEMSRRIYDGIRSPSIRQFAEMVVRNWAKVPASQQLTNRQAAQIFLDYIRSNVRYRPDPHNTELTQSAAITLCVPGAAICIPVEDCDGLTVAFDSLAGAYGIPVKILHQVFGSSDQEHVLGLIQTDDGDWLPADPSASSDKPVGWKSSAATRENVIDPLDPATIQRVGTNEAEFIGIGGFAVHRRRARSVGRLLGVGFIAPADVNALMQQLDPQMDSLDAVFRTCTGLSSDDLSAWSGFYASWNALVARWRTFTNAHWWQPWLIVDAVWIASDTLTQMQGYSTALASWQAKAKTVCTYSPPPAPVVQPPQLTPSTAVDDIAKAAGAITGVIVAGTAAYLVIDAVGWLNALKPHRAANPVRRRRRRR